MNPHYTLARLIICFAAYLFVAPNSSIVSATTQHNCESSNYFYPDSSKIGLQYIIGIGSIRGDVKWTTGTGEYLIDHGYSLSLQILLSNLISKESSTGGWGLLCGMDLNPIARQVEWYKSQNGALWPVDPSWQVKQNLFYLALCLVDENHSLLQRFFPKALFSYQLLLGLGLNYSDWDSSLLGTPPRFGPDNKLEFQQQKLGISYIGAIKYDHIWFGVTYHKTKSRAAIPDSNVFWGYVTSNTWRFNIGYCLY